MGKNDWIVEQTRRGVTQFDRAMMSSYQYSNTYLQCAREYLNAAGEFCNETVASEHGSCLGIIDFDDGWATAMLSHFEAVETPYALRFSQHCLRTAMTMGLPTVNGCSGPSID